jgi:ferric-chelate reductase
MNSGFVSYIWPCFVIWGLDRFIRLVRLVVFNTSLGTSASHADASMEACAELVTSDLVRLTMKRPKHFRWDAGQTAYLILPTVSALPIEAHPFTIASYDSNEVSRGDDNEKVPPMWKDLVFLINVREGFTKHLKEVALKEGRVPALVDGPYGPSPELDHFDTVVLVAGMFLPMHFRSLSVGAYRPAFC